MPRGARGSQAAVFGPVPSRRLGLSLGVDPLVPKTCTLDCIYCELGRTTCKTTTRSRMRPVEELLEELKEVLESLQVPPDYITVAGSGEPTLHLGLGELIEGIKGLWKGPVAVLTNATLTPDPQVRAELALADVVVPSLDAATPHTFQRINRPAPGLELAEIIEGIRALASRGDVRVWLEILVVKGVNDSEQEITALAEVVRAIAPERLHLGTLHRPPAEEWVRAVAHSRLREIARAFAPITVEIIPPPTPSTTRSCLVPSEEVIAMTRRRPCTISDIAKAVGLGEAQARELVERLAREGKVVAESFGQQVFYRAIG